MILSLFLVLVLIAIFLIVIGVWTRESVYPVVGFTFIFFLSAFVFMPGHIEVVSGSNISVSYSYVNGSISGADVNSVDVLTSFDDSTSRWMGRWLMIVSALGIVLSSLEVRKIFGGKDKDE